MRGPPATARRAGPWGPLAWRTDRLDSHRRPCEEGRMPRAVVIHASGGPEVLSLERHDPGVPGAGAVRVRVNAAGVNFIDVYFRAGLYPAPLPFVVGLEGAGVVEAVGEGVAGLAPGDRVAWASVPGSYAEAVVAPADRLVRVPDAVPVDVAYDSVGATTFDGSLAALRPRGLLILFGQSSGPVPPFDLQRLNLGGSLFITRPSLAHYARDRAELELRAGALLGAVAAGRLRVRIGARFPLAEAAAAHRALEGRATAGKVLLLPG